MRFIGNKENLLDFIFGTMQAQGIKGATFCDFFAGTGNVGRYFKDKRYKIIASDLLYFSYVLQRAYIKNNKEPKFTKLLKEIETNSSLLMPRPIDLVVEYLNSIKGKEGFIYTNYTPEGTKNLDQPRTYFIGENGKKIDAIRETIEDWKNNKLVSEDEYFILLACLIESVPFYANISGVYAAFLKQWDPRAVKPFALRPITLYVNSDKEHEVYNKNSMQLLGKVKTDVLYLDPPYNERQYAPNYHLLETIAKYDNPELRGVVGMRDYTEQKSDFCNKGRALLALQKIAAEADYKYLLLSYNSEGIMPKEGIMKALSVSGEVKLIEMEYLRFKSNSNGDSKHKKHIQEQLYILKKS